MCVSSDRNDGWSGWLSPELGRTTKTSRSEGDVRRHHDTRYDTRPLIDRIAADYGSALWLLARVLIGIIFVQSGFEKLTALGSFAAMLGNRGVPLAQIFAPIGAAVEF